mmetsp:Transcript_16104/g.34810  ORF Transcript_16104/g.34810 Transcript_16104/m.34810 type:complete len:282 (+) Transcript_16104:1344-2189(+)
MFRAPWWSRQDPWWSFRAHLGPWLCPPRPQASLLSAFPCRRYLQRAALPRTASSFRSCVWTRPQPCGGRSAGPQLSPSCPLAPLGPSRSGWSRGQQWVGLHPPPGPAVARGSARPSSQHPPMRLHQGLEREHRKLPTKSRRPGLKHLDSLPIPSPEHQWQRSNWPSCLSTPSLQLQNRRPLSFEQRWLSSHLPRSSPGRRRAPRSWTRRPRPRYRARRCGPPRRPSASWPSQLRSWHSGWLIGTNLCILRRPSLPILHPSRFCLPDFRADRSPLKEDLHLR